MKRRALGKGLGSLLPDRATAVADGLIQVELEKVARNPSQPRESFDAEELEELAMSIRSAGILQPILVRRTAEGYELIAGERRLKAARMAGLSKVPALVQHVESGKSLELALIENIQRQQLNPIEEARAFAALIEQHGLTQEAVAERVGRKRPSVANALRLLKLPERVQVMLRDGRLAAGHAKALLSLDDEEQILEAADALARGESSVREAEEMARGRRKAPVRAADLEAADPNVRDAEVRLQRALGTKVRIRMAGGGKGRIEISFYSDEELQRLFDLLEGQSH